MYTANEVAVADGFARIITLNRESNDKDGNPCAYPSSCFWEQSYSLSIVQAPWLVNTMSDNPWRQLVSWIE
jgi:hypothetical protein